MVKDITKNRRKLSVLFEQSTTFSEKSVLVVCLRAAIADMEPDTTCFELLELEGITANDIIESLLACLHKYGFVDHLLGGYFVVFACDGASVMLGRRTGVATQLCARFPDLTQIPERIGSVCTVSGGAFLSLDVFCQSAWGASSKKTVKAVFYRMLQVHFSNAANDITRDSTERAKYKEFHDVLTYVPCVFILGVMMP